MGLSQDERWRLCDDIYNVMERPQKERVIQRSGPELRIRIDESNICSSLLAGWLQIRSLVISMPLGVIIDSSFADTDF
uniref:Uncharacterized protein n=1 Tax=Knipowitschia caucasica TaxID=637954 RepID=A0AAV2JGS1_KNICA